MRLFFIIITSMFLTACNTTTPLPTMTSNTSAKELFENKHYKESLIIFEQESTPEAQYYLGKAYLYGLGCNKNVVKAYKYAKKSAKAKYPAGINLLAVLYANGDGVNKDELQALVYYKEAAKLGSTKAMINIGEMYAIGGFIKPDSKKSIYWVKKAYDNGNVRAIRVLGNLYASSDIKEYEKAIQYYNIFLNHQDADSSRFSSVYLRLGDVYKDLNNQNKSIYYYKKSAELNNEDAIMAIIYMKNPYSFMSKEEHLNWMKKGVEAKNKLAYLPLYLYYLDNNIKKDAKDFAYKAYYEDKNIEMGCYLSDIYREEYDYIKSNAIANEIVLQNKTSHVPSCYNTLVALYKSGYGVAKNINIAILLQKKSFATSDNFYKDDAAVSLAELYLEKLHDYENAQKWYKIAYDLSKDKSYLTKVAEFKKTLPNFKDKDLSKIKQKVYPIIDNFTKKEQVVTVLESQRYYFIALDQKSINMYDKTSLKLIRTFRGWIGEGIAGITVQMAYDEKNKLLYCTGLNSTVDFSKNDLIKVFNINTGVIVNTINNKNSIKSIYLNISDNGKYLVSVNVGAQLNIINTSNNKIQYYNFSNIVNFTKANIIKKGDDYLINALGNDKKLYTFSVNKKRQISKQAFTYQTKFKSFNGSHAQGILNNKSNNYKIENIRVSDNQLYIKTTQQKLIKNFNFKTLTLVNTNKQIDFPLEKKPNIGIQYKNNKTSVEIYKNKQLLSNIEFFNTPVLTHKIINNKYIILVTNDITAMYIFNLQGKPIAKLESLNSIQTNIVYQGGYLVTYGNDNIIHLWNLDNLDKLNTIKESYDEDILHGMSKIIGGNILEMLNEPDEDLLEIAKLQSKQNNLSYTQTPQQLKSYIKMFCLKKEVIYPITSLYIKNDDWIMYNNKGYFTSSHDGRDLIKYHLNQGLKKEAKIIDNTQIFEKFYRPDIIRKLLTKKTITDSLDIKQVLQNINPPTISILKNELKDKKNLELTYRICDSGSGISNTSILLNNIQRNIANSRGFSIEKKEANINCTVYRNVLTLKSGKNSIAVKSFDKTKTISTTTIPIEVMSKFKVAKKSNLHFLSIAVSNYKDDSLKLKYSVSDVNAVEKKFKLHSKELFEKIYTYELHEKDVTLDKIDAMFNKISEKAEINDVFILYIAGHGVTNSKDGLYYYLPYDIANTGSNGLKKSAVSINDIIHQLGKIKAQKSLILLDTCDSGGAIDNDAVVNRLSNATQRNYIVASSKNQAALEGYKNHGVFTYTVLEAFDKAYFGDNKTLTVTSLAAFVQMSVPKITKEQFHYEQVPQKYLNGDLFPIGIK